MIIKGNNEIRLRTVEVADSEFILSLRTDPKLNQHLSSVENDIEKQKKFIQKYKTLEKQKKEYYFIIEYKNLPVGSVRLYNIDYHKSTFTWGSWIVKQNNPGEVALSSAYMSYYFGFQKLLLNKAEIDVRKTNFSVFKFHQTYCDFVKEDDLNFYLELKKEKFHCFIDKFHKRISNELEIIYKSN